MVDFNAAIALISLRAFVACSGGVAGSMVAIDDPLWAVLDPRGRFLAE